MKKVSVIFIGLMLSVTPMLANATALQASDTYSDPLHLASGDNYSATLPQYQIKGIDDSEGGHIASTAYVKGAYNSAIRGVNRLANDKQEKLVGNSETVATGANATNTLGQASNSSGPVITSISASNGVVTVTKGQVTIPVGSSSASTQAQIWLD